KYAALVTFTTRTEPIENGSRTHFDHLIRVIDLATRKEVRSITPDKNSEQFLSVTFAPDGKALAVGLEDGSVRFYDPATGRRQGIVLGQKAVPLSLCYSPEGSTLAVGDKDGEVRLWDVKTGKWRRLLEGQRAAVWSVLFTPDGKHLVTCADSGV